MKTIPMYTTSITAPIGRAVDSLVFDCWYLSKLFSNGLLTPESWKYNSSNLTLREFSSR